MSEIKVNGIAMTNPETGSVAKAQHSPPTVTLMGRVAANVLGHAGRLGPGGKTDLHFTLIIDDAYSGIFGIDGQFAVNTGLSIDRYDGSSGTLGNFAVIRSNFYRNELPSDALVQMKVDPPAGMSVQKFAQELIRNAHNFASFTAPYSVPKKIVMETMVEGEYNSSSYIAGLLRSVMGYVPALPTPGYQRPGWDSPIPASYFKGEALR